MLQNYILEFSEQINSLRDFVDRMIPIIQEEKLNTFEELLNVYGDDFINQHSQKTPPLLEGVIDEISNDFNISGLEKIDLDNLNKSNYTFHIGSEDEKIIMKGTGDLILINEKIEKITMYENQKKNLLKSSFVAIINHSEWFFSQLLSFYYNKYPESSGVDSKQLKYGSIKDLDKVVDVKDYLIESIIEGILRGSIESWIDTLKKGFGLNLAYLDKGELIEIWQRRNIIVHNGGKINSIYLSRVADKYKTEYNKNDQIVINIEYFHRTADKLYLSFVLIAMELWKKLNKGDEKRGHLLLKLSYENILKKKWKIAEGLSFFLRNDKSIPSNLTTIGLINYWLSKKKNGDYDSIEKEINKADFSDKKDIYKLAYFALTDNEEKFFVLLNKVSLSSKSTEDILSIGNILEFPVFEDMRKNSLFDEFLSQNRKLIDEYLDNKNHYELTFSQEDFLILKKRLKQIFDKMKD